MKFQAVEDLKKGQDLQWYGIVPIGIAARDIKAGEEVHYDPNKNTADVIVFEQPDDAHTS